VPGAAATCHGHTIGAEKLPGDFQCVKAAAAFTRGSLTNRLGWFGFHCGYFPKPSAIAMALRIAMDLLIVS